LLFQLQGRHKQEGLGPGQSGQNCEALLEKITKAKRAGGLTQVVECLAGKHEALSSNTSTNREKKIRVGAQRRGELKQGGSGSRL
jgi:hypothetical protein